MSNMLCLNEDISKFSIVIPNDADVNESYFAKLLKKHIFDTCSVSLTVCTVDNTTEGFKILVGRASSLKSTDDCFYIKSIEGSLELSASNSIGYEAMINYIRSKLITSDSSIIKETELVIPSVDVLTDTSAKYASYSKGDVRIIYNNVYGHPKTESGPVDWVVNNHDLRESMLLSLYEAYGADVIGLQEFTAHTSRKLFEAKLLSAGYTEAAPNVLSETPLFYKKDRLELIKSGYTLYDIENDGNSKSITWAIFKTAEKKQPFILLSTHFAWRGGESGENGRRAHIAQILGIINDIRTGEYADAPVIFGGDLNYMFMYSPSLSSIIRDAGYNSTWEAALEKNDCCGHHPYSVFDEESQMYVKWTCPTDAYEKSIDQSWFKGELKVNFYATLTDFYTNLASDHCPQVIDITF